MRISLVYLLAVVVAVVWWSDAAAVCPLGVSYDSDIETGNCEAMPQGHACFSGCEWSISSPSGGVSVCLSLFPAWAVRLTSTGQECGYSGLNPSENLWMAAQTSGSYSCVYADGTPCGTDGGGAGGESGGSVNPQCGDHECAWSNTGQTCWSLTANYSFWPEQHLGMGSQHYFWASNFNELAAVYVAWLSANGVGEGETYKYESFVVSPTGSAGVTVYYYVWSNGAWSALKTWSSGIGNSYLPVSPSTLCDDYAYWDFAHSQEGPGGVMTASSMASANVGGMAALLSAQVGELGNQIAGLVGAVCTDPLDPATCSMGGGGVAVDVTGVEVALGGIDSTMGDGLAGIAGALTSVGNAVSALGAWQAPTGVGGFLGEGLSEADQAKAEFAAGWNSIKGEAAGYFSAALAPVVVELPCWSTHLPGLDVDFELCLQPWHDQLALLGLVLLSAATIVSVLYVVK